MDSMEKIQYGGSFLLAPVPVVLVGCAHKELGKNLITIAWTGYSMDRLEPEKLTDVLKKVMEECVRYRAYFSVYRGEKKFEIIIDCK